MSVVLVCENHPRRTHVGTYRLVDGHGIAYDRHFCSECDRGFLQDEAEAYGEEAWRFDADLNMIRRLPRCNGECGGGNEYHAGLVAA